jgi:hypothetical protein
MWPRPGSICSRAFGSAWTSARACRFGLTIMSLSPDRITVGVWIAL